MTTNLKWWFTSCVQIKRLFWHSKWIEIAVWLLVGICQTVHWRQTVECSDYHVLLPDGHTQLLCPWEMLTRITSVDYFHDFVHTGNKSLLIIFSYFSTWNWTLPINSRSLETRESGQKRLNWIGRDAGCCFCTLSLSKNRAWQSVKQPLIGLLYCIKSLYRVLYISWKDQTTGLMYHHVWFVISWAGENPSWFSSCLSNGKVFLGKVGGFLVNWLPIGSVLSIEARWWTSWPPLGV